MRDRQEWLEKAQQEQEERIAAYHALRAERQQEIDEARREERARKLAEKETQEAKNEEDSNGNNVDGKNNDGASHKEMSHISLEEKVEGHNQEKVEGHNQEKVEGHNQDTTIEKQSSELVSTNEFIVVDDSLQKEERNVTEMEIDEKDESKPQGEIKESTMEIDGTNIIETNTSCEMEPNVNNGTKLEITTSMDVISQEKITVPQPLNIEQQMEVEERMDVDAVTTEATEKDENEAATIHDPASVPICLSQEHLYLTQNMTVAGAEFIIQIHGRKEIPAAGFISCPLAAFAGVIAASELRPLMTCQHENMQHVLKLHYFAGVNSKSNTNDGAAQIVGNCINIHNFIENYFVNDSDIIRKCVADARSLFVTATSCSGREEIVGCLNYGALARDGIFVNWLVVSDDEVNDKVYGHQLVFSCGNNLNWRRHNIATFLLQIAKLAYESKQYVERAREDTNSELSPCQLVLQCRSSSDASRFFYALGFNEHDHVEGTSEVDGFVYKGFAEETQKLATSKSDYINFIIGGKKDLVVYTYTSGNFFEQHSHKRDLKIYKQFNELVQNQQSKQNDCVFFPFNIKREHLLILSINLDLFYLPFHPDIMLDNYLQPNHQFNPRHCVSIYGNDISEVAASPTKWYNGRIIDFLSRW
jgi:hypothetical protein